MTEELLQYDELPDIKEVVYSSDMNDAELDKILGKAGHKIAEAIREGHGATHGVPKGRLEGGYLLAGIISCCLVLVGGFWAVLHFVVSSDLEAALSPLNTKVATFGEQETGLRRDVDRLLDKVARNSLSEPTTDSKEIIEAANHLRDRRIQTPIQRVVTAGLALSKSQSPNDWNAALALASYKSFLDNPNVSVPEASERPDPTNYDIPAKGSELFTSHKGVAMDQAARFEEIGKTLNANRKLGPDMLYLTGGRINLNNQYLRHVVVMNTEVHLSNNNVKLEDVLFVNCSFIFDDAPTERKLTEKILSSNRVTFDSLG